MYNRCIAGWYVCLKMTIAAVWWNGPAANVWAKERNPTTLHSAFSMIKCCFNHVGMHPTLKLQWLSNIAPIQNSTASFLCRSYFLHLVDRMQQTICTTSLSHWNNVSGSTPALYQIYTASLTLQKYRSWSTYYAKLANLWTHHAMWLSSSPSGISHHSAKSTVVSSADCLFFIIGMIGALVRGILSCWRCSAAFTFCSQY